jgi:hypothetical protein
VPAIFSRSFDGRVRQAAVGAIVALGLFAFGWYYYALPSYTRVGYAPEQPVAFSHEQHVGKLGLDCAYCHQSVFDSPVASVPTSRTCMNCHDPKKANVKGTSPLLAAVRSSVDTGRPIEWKRVHKLPEYAYFNHAVHVNKGVSCASCHGQVNEMKVIRHAKEMSMGWCLKCHDDPHASLRPIDRVTDLTWKAEANGQTASEVGAGIQKDLRVKAPMNCQSCHR